MIRNSFIYIRNGVRVLKNVHNPFDQDLKMVRLKWNRMIPSGLHGYSELLNGRKLIGIFNVILLVSLSCGSIASNNLLDAARSRQ